MSNDVLSATGTAGDIQPIATARRSPFRQPGTGGVLAVITVLAAITLLFLLTTDSFANWGNVKAILAASSFVGIVAIGQTGIMTSGNFFSMSLGVQAATSAILFLWSLRYGLVPAIALTLAFGALVSGIQGYVIGIWGASPIIITIASSVLISGVVVLITHGSGVRPPAGAPSIDFLAERVGGVNVSVIVLLAVAILVQLFLSRTRYGALTQLVGANKAAARAAGLPVTATIVVIFVIAGLCGAVAGIMLSAFQQNASLSLQGTLTFDSIAAVLVGGCSVLGGRGSAIATLLGALTISAINSALVLRGYSDGIQILIKGLIVLAAVVAVHLWSRGRR